ncbi:hypothetical protein K493DRAFT_311608 [Basidiobolus meristosporus CBS 931.73]|uniref:UBZ4-type domain-containing protein n=1 Tax=Basidiobolus meristosporus CBS 931.73 TaxID=1314790 RepID=A0A1Y1Z108_9FUNG|nr:hypothetical protein K493DRAFT_311608 [Basidiobolus meristosporus CBS 931.73]|eukprot:ORY03804.1 hypothetical protein K493DRAFT_311608 [Basidiobolus meristosporus CBS 931.73]
MRSQSFQSHTEEDLPSDEEKQIELAIALSLQEAENQEKQSLTEDCSVEILDISPRKMYHSDFEHDTDASLDRENEILEFDLTELEELPDKDDIISTPVRPHSKSALNTGTLHRFASKLNVTTPKSSPIDTVHSSILNAPFEGRSQTSSGSSGAQPFKSHNNSNTTRISSTPPNSNTRTHAQSEYSTAFKPSRIFTDGDDNYPEARNSSSPLFSRSSSRMIICSSPEDNSLNDFDLLPPKLAIQSPFKGGSPKAGGHSLYSQRNTASPISPRVTKKMPKIFPDSPQSAKRQLYDDKLSLTPTKRRPESAYHLESAKTRSSIKRSEEVESPSKYDKKSDMISCPICQKEFSKSVVEAHASDCNGPVTLATLRGTIHLQKVRLVVLNQKAKSI